MKRFSNGAGGIETITKLGHEKAFGSGDASMSAERCSAWLQKEPGINCSLKTLALGHVVSLLMRPVPGEEGERPQDNPPHSFPQNRRQEEPGHAVVSCSYL